MKSKNRPQPPRLEFWKNFRAPVAVAHRGGDGAGTDKENSLRAFEAAYKLGYRWFETDVVATKDKKLLAIHGRGYQLHPNEDLPSRSRLRWLTYAKIKARIRVGGEDVLLFEELLDKFPDVKIFVDPKTFRSVPALINIMTNRPQDIKRVCVGAFSKMRTFRTAIIIKHRTGKEVCISLLGPINAYPIYLAARFRFLRPFTKYYVHETRAGSAHVPYGWITRSPKAGRKLISYAHSLGLKVAVYTPNSEKAISTALESGVDVIMSDNVKSLMKQVKANS